MSGLVRDLSPCLEAVGGVTMLVTLQPEEEEGSSETWK